MAFIDNYNTAIDLDFRNRVRSAMLKVALAVGGEDETDKQLIYVTKRANAANFTIYNQVKAVDILSHLICSLGTITTASSDNDIEWSLTSVWDDYSGVLQNETTVPV